jgi:hypothetical protein
LCCTIIVIRFALIVLQEEEIDDGAEEKLEIEEEEEIEKEEEEYIYAPDQNYEDDDNSYDRDDDMFDDGLGGDEWFNIVLKYLNRLYTPMRRKEV